MAIKERRGSLVRDEAREYFEDLGVIKQSDRPLRSGEVAKYYIDFDAIMQDPYRCEGVIRQYTEEVEEISQHDTIDALCFIQKRGGTTIGAIMLAAALRHLCIIT